MTVKGPKGTLEKALPVEMSIKLEDGHVVVTCLLYTSIHLPEDT